MFSKLFHKKALGFKFLGDSIKYTLITLNNHSVIVNETQLFKLNCKTALHRLQHLLTKYPSCFVLDEAKPLLAPGPEDITKHKDRKKVVKNKVESLVENKKVSLNLQGHLPKKKAPFLIIHEDVLIEHEARLQKLGLKPQKIILCPESLLSLESFFSQKCPKKVLLYFTKERIELLLLKEGHLVFIDSIYISKLKLHEIEKSILRRLLAHFSPKEEMPLHFHGNHRDLKELSSRLEKETGLKSKESPYGSFEEEFPGYLVEMGAALSLLKEEGCGFQRPTLSMIYKIYKKSLIANALLIMGLFIVSYFFWNYQDTYIQNENKKLFEKGFLSLSKGGDTPVVYSQEQISELNALLKKKKKEDPSFLFHPNSFLVTDTLAWLSEISEDLRSEKSSPPFIIESFKYNLTSRPTSKKGSTPYRVKVSFSFSTDSSLIARKVHDKIAASKEVVDRSKKIDWSYQNNSYQISFFLKNNIVKGGGHA